MRKLLLSSVALIAMPAIFIAQPNAAEAAGKPLAISVLCTSPVIEGQGIPCKIGKSGGNGSAITIKWTSGTQTGVTSLGKGGTGAFTVKTVDDAVVNGQRQVVISAVVTSGSTRAAASAVASILDNDLPPPVPCPDGTAVPAGQTCPSPPPPPPTPPSGTIAYGSTVIATQACLDKFENGTMLTIGAAYKVTGMWGYSLMDGTFTAGQPSGYLTLDDTAGLKGDGWFSYHVPIECVRPA